MAAEVSAEGTTATPGVLRWSVELLLGLLGTAPGSGVKVENGGWLLTIILTRALRHCGGFQQYGQTPEIHGNRNPSSPYIFHPHKTIAYL